ncbi:MAG TPA: hypothetical protein V6D14_21000 [Coleofasciculaceae cyanobacterium]|jgi:hypothetical protein
MEHCSVVYYWKNLSRAQALNQLFQESKELPESDRNDWNDFLNQMAQERWELTAAVSLISSDVSRETIAYFKRSC